MKLIKVSIDTYINLDYLKFLRYQEYYDGKELQKEIVLNVDGAGRMIIDEDETKAIGKEVKDLYTDILLLAMSK